MPDVTNSVFYSSPVLMVFVVVFCCVVMCVMGGIELMRAYEETLKILGISESIDEDDCDVYDEIIKFMIQVLIMLFLVCFILDSLVLPVWEMVRCVWKGGYFL